MGSKRLHITANASMSTRSSSKSDKRTKPSTWVNPFAQALNQLDATMLKSSEKRESSEGSLVVVVVDGLNAIFSYEGDERWYSTSNNF